MERKRGFSGGEKGWGCEPHRAEAMATCRNWFRNCSLGKKRVRESQVLRGGGEGGVPRVLRACRLPRHHHCPPQWDRLGCRLCTARGASHGRARSCHPCCHPSLWPFPSPYHPWETAAASLGPPLGALRLPSCCDTGQWRSFWLFWNDPSLAIRCDTAVREGIALEILD